MTQALAKTDGNGLAVAVEAAVMGDLSKLQPGDRVRYYNAVCESLGLNPLTRPFDYITLNGKLTLYAKRDATDQLRAKHAVSVAIVGRDFLQEAGIYVVTARATTPDGRTDESLGAVNIKGLTGENLANALMKCETKAKRRVTLSISGLGWTDETEVGSIPGSHSVAVDMDSGEILPPVAIEGAALSHASSSSPKPATRAPQSKSKAAQPDASLRERLGVPEDASLPKDIAAEEVKAAMARAREVATVEEIRAFFEDTGDYHEGDRLSGKHLTAWCDREGKTPMQWADAVIARFRPAPVEGEVVDMEEVSFD